MGLTVGEGAMPCRYALHITRLDAVGDEDIHMTRDAGLTGAEAQASAMNYLSNLEQTGFTWYSTPTPYSWFAEKLAKQPGDKPVYLAIHLADGLSLEETGGRTPNRHANRE